MAGPDVMLAKATKGAPHDVLTQLLREGDWWFELKFDGIRAVLSRSVEGTVRITNRRQVDITHRYPDVVATWAGVEFTGVLDGEIIVLTDGRPDFAGAHLRDAQSSWPKIRAAAASAPATFMPFDILEAAGTDVRGLRYVERRELLAGVGMPVSVASQDGEAMWAFVLDQQLEGLVAKRADSTYRPGRHGAWRKLKLTRRISALVGAMVAGGGAKEGPLRALQLYLFDPDAGVLVGIGTVGSGIRDVDLTSIRARMNTAQPTVVEVEFLEVSASGQLRMPVFKGIRKDIAAAECVIATLRG